MNVALYVRVSPRDGRQDTRNQLLQLRGYCKKEGWTITGEYVDKGSSADLLDPPKLATLLADAEKRKFTRVVIWSLDCISRRGVAETFSLIQRLRAARVSVWSLTEEHFRTEGAAGTVLVAVSAWIARHERQRLRENISNGARRAQLEGKQLGRPPADYGPNEVLALRRAGMKLATICDQTGLSRQSVYLKLKAARLAS